MRGSPWRGMLLWICVSFLGVACAGPSRAGTIGAVLGRHADGRVHLRDVPSHLAAGQAGLLPGDEILLIEGRDVRPLSEAELRRLLSGEPGDPLRLTVIRGESVLRLTLVRTRAERYRVH